MKKSSIIVFAEKTQQKLYRALSFKGEKIEIYSCKESFNFLPELEALVILVDCGFEIRLGLKLLKEIKKAHPHIPVIIITDKSSEDLAIQAFRLGAREYIRKPLDTRELLSAVESLLRIQKKSQKKREPFGQTYKNDEMEFQSSIKSDMPINLISVMHHIELNLSENISLADCAKKAKLSKYHFCRYFKKQMGTTPMKFIKQLRVERAKRLLRRNDLNIAEIAYAVGFNHYNGFIRAFKEIEGVTPKQFRESPGENQQREQ